MKILITLFISVLSTTLFAQECIRSANLQPTDVKVSGSATLIQQGDTLVVQLSNDFKSDPGPDLDVYLSNETNPSSTGLKLGALKSLNGEQLYDVPNDVNLADYKFISIHCTRYNHLYAYAELNSSEGDCDAVLSVSNHEFDELKIGVHNQQIQISTPAKQKEYYSIEIYNQQGQLVSSGKASKHIYHANTGLYIIKVASTSLVTTQKVWVP